MATFERGPQGPAGPPGPPGKDGTGGGATPGGTVGSVQVRGGDGLTGVAPGTDDNVLTSVSGAWASVAPVGTTENGALKYSATELEETSDATPTDIGDAIPLVENSHTIVDAQVTAVRAGATRSRSFNVRREFLNTAGTITAAPTVDSQGPSLLGGSFPVSADIVYSGTNAQVRVTGIAATYVRWRAVTQVDRLAGAAAPPFSPIDLLPTLWVEGPYTGPHWPNAGYGAGLTDEGVTTPLDALTSLNGIPIATNPSGNRYLYGPKTDVVFSNGAGTALVLFNVTSASAPGATAIDDPAIISDRSSPRVNLSFNTSGLRATLYESAGATRRTTPYIACPTGSWRIGMLRWNSTIIECSLNGGTPVSTACTAADLGTLDLFVLRSGFAAKSIIGSVGGVFCVDYAMSNDDVANMVAYWQGKFAL